MQTLNGLIALITGGTSGIGREAALDLAARGVHVVIVGRNAAKANAIIASQSKGSAPIRFIQADLSEMDQVRRVAEQFLNQKAELHLLIHSAGIHHYERTLTVDGVEYNFAANYLNRFLLTHLLLPTMQTSGGARIVVVGSPYVFDPVRGFNFEGLQGERPMRPLVGLLKAGMANSVWTVSLSRRLRGGDVGIYNMIPGIAQTDILRNDPLPIRWMDKILQPLQGMSAAQAGRNYAMLATTKTPPVKGENVFVKNTRRGVVETKVPRGTFDVALGERLWTFSERLTKTHAEPITRQVLEGV